MKKFKKFAYLLLIIIIVILAFTIYTNASQNNEKDDKQKTLTEIKFVESEIENLLNTMNNIEARNYKVTYGEISKSSDSSSSQGEKSGTEGYAYRLEALQIKLVPKGTENPELPTPASAKKEAFIKK